MSLRVLVVDDEPNVRRVIALQLEHDGYDVQEAADGEAANAHDKWRDGSGGAEIRPVSEATSAHEPAEGMAQRRRDDAPQRSGPRGLHASNLLGARTSSQTEQPGRRDIQRRRMPLRLRPPPRETPPRPLLPAEPMERRPSTSRLSAEREALLGAVPEVVRRRVVRGRGAAGGGGAVTADNPRGADVDLAVACFGASAPVKTR